MELYVFDTNINLIHIVENFTSLIWTRRYFNSGEFELHLPLTIENIEFLIKGNIIYKKDDIEAGYIETRQIEVNEEGNEVLKINGKFIINYINRRINWGQLLFNGKSEALMRKLINDNCINPSNSSRKIPLLELGELKNYTETIEYQNSYGSLEEELESIALTNEFGYRINFNHIEKKLIFEVYKGVNRSVNQSLIAPCIFSRDFENILEQEYTDSLNNYRNTVLIAGAGEGKDRKITFIEEGNGLDRYELYVDARDLQNTEQVEKKDSEGNINTEDVLIPDSKYMPMLIQRGKEKLSECCKIQTFNSKINTNGNNIYKKDYDLGDIVTVIDKKWGIQLNTRITEIEEVYEEKGLEINIVFGNDIPTIIDKIKQKVR